jgi:hypothetical protein
MLLTHGGIQIPILRTVTTMTWQDHNYYVDSFVEVDGRATQGRR